MGLWNCLHISMGCVYTIFGLIQVIAGLFFLTSMRMIKLCGNVWVGTLVSMNLQVVKYTGCFHFKCKYFQG